MNIQQQDTIPEEGSLEAVDPFSAAPPGYSLTQDNQNFPWENPPEISDPEEALDQAIDFLDNPRNQKEVFKLLTAGVSVEVLVEGYTMQGFQEGKFSADTGLLIKTPLALYMANLAEENIIAYRFFERDDPLNEGGMSDKDFFDLLSINNPKMFAKIKDDVARQIREGNTSAISGAEEGMI